MRLAKGSRDELRQGVDLKAHVFVKLTKGFVKNSIMRIMDILIALLGGIEICLIVLKELNLNEYYIES